MGNVHGRGRVLARDASEEVEVELDAVGEQRLGERGVVDRRGAEELVHGDEPKELGEVAGEVVERPEPVRRPVLPDRREAVLVHAVAVEVADRERPVRHVVVGSRGEVVEPHAREPAERSVGRVRCAAAERRHLAPLGEPDGERAARVGSRGTRTCGRRSPAARTSRRRRPSAVSCPLPAAARRSPRASAPRPSRRLRGRTGCGPPRAGRPSTPAGRSTRPGWRRWRSRRGGRRTRPRRPGSRRPSS